MGLAALAALVGADTLLLNRRDRGQDSADRQILLRGFLRGLWGSETLGPLQHKMENPRQNFSVKNRFIYAETTARLVSDSSVVEI